MFDGAVYCPSCGARRARAEGGARQAPCPACKGAMRELAIGDTALLECARCHGTWVDAKTFEHICASQDAQAAVLHRWSHEPSRSAGQTTRAGGSGAKPPKEIDVRYRKCVACGTMMNRMNFGRLSGTIVDVCRGHGTYLDRGELHAVVRFIEGGGLDRARERQLEDLKEQEQRLRQAQLARPASAAADFDYESWTRTDLQRLLDQLRRD